MKHIERHIHRGGQVREFKSKTLKQLPPHSSEIKFQNCAGRAWHPEHTEKQAGKGERTDAD